VREVEESAYWLELLAAAGTVSAAKLEPLRKEADELTAIFVTILKLLKGL
jgi:four helix bundle protein